MKALWALATLAVLGVQAAQAGPEWLDIPASAATFDDGRAPVQDLYSAYRPLLEAGWQIDLIAESRPEGTELALPIVALRSPQSGPAAWFITGVHGEETAGPNAMARAVDALAELGRSHPVVVLPLANPQGYARNWRYLNVAVYSEEIDGQSVGDSSHSLLNESGDGPRAAAASSPEAGAINDYILQTAPDYPPRYSIDLHEDDLIHEGYVYSQGVEGAADPLAVEAVGILRAYDIPVKMDGQTRLGEGIEGGIIGPGIDSSVDELMSAEHVWMNGGIAPGPRAHTVLVFETPAARIALEQRIGAHETLLRRIAQRIARTSAD